MSTERPHHFGHLLKFQKKKKKNKSLQPLILYISFHDLINVYGRGSGANNLTRYKILISTEISCHFGHLLQVSRKSLWSLILYAFFMILYMYKAPGQTTPWGQNIDLFGHLLQVSKNLFGIWYYIQFLKILYMYIAPGQGRQPTGWQFWCEKGFITLSICCKF